ncbi:UDP-N-acetylmuramate--L-alanine ligase, partial [Candidatus Roizmanbacteria bacterium CG09_land_8_20_14_0_10_41_9]
MQGYKNIFLVGIKGVCMANISLVLKKMGRQVSGSDVADEFITDELLKENNIPFFIGFEKNKLPENTDLVIYSSSHSGDHNPQVLEAKKRGIDTMSQAQVLKELTQSFHTSIAVCGSHGKTTTASLLSYALIQLNVQPSYIVGTSKFNSIWGGDYAGHTTFVIEADEY